MKFREACDLTESEKIDEGIFGDALKKVGGAIKSGAKHVAGAVADKVQSMKLGAREPDHQRTGGNWRLEQIIKDMRARLLKLGIDYDKSRFPDEIQFWSNGTKSNVGDYEFKQAGDILEMYAKKWKDEVANAPDREHSAQMAKLADIKDRMGNGGGLHSGGGPSLNAQRTARTQAGIQASRANTEFGN